MGQFEGLEDADEVLVNSFRDMEPKVSIRGSSPQYVFC
jgi:hypothetical protein